MCLKIKKKEIGRYKMSVCVQTLQGIVILYNFMNIALVLNVVKSHKSNVIFKSDSFWVILSFVFVYFMVTSVFSPNTLAMDEASR